MSGDKVKTGLIGAVVVAALALFIWLDNREPAAEPYSSSTIYDGEPIPAFTATDSERLAEDLARLEEQHGGVCFGWSLTDGSTSGGTEFGSSRGAAVPADTCQRWAQVDVTVGYTSASSESMDGAAITVSASDDLSSAAGIGLADFQRLGIDVEQLVDDPVASTGYAALALPLLMVERGDLPPATEPQTTAPATGTLPPADSSDAPTTQLVIMIGAGLIGLGLLVAGLVVWWKNRQAEPETETETET
ncbi:MAG: hypothetical protein ACRDQB_15670 [Thermocrispum sp.]